MTDMPDRKLFSREYGQGLPLLFLHGGWGYEFYPFDFQIEHMLSRFRILIPDRTGYGKSPRITSFPRNFHEHAAEEMRQFLDGQGIDRCFLWGHSDGAVLAARMAIRQPERFPPSFLRRFITIAASRPREAFSRRQQPIRQSLVPPFRRRWRASTVQTTGSTC